MNFLNNREQNFLSSRIPNTCFVLTKEGGYTEHRRQLLYRVLLEKHKVISKNSVYNENYTYDIVLKLIIQPVCYAHSGIDKDEDDKFYPPLLVYLDETNNKRQHFVCQTCGRSFTIDDENFKIHNCNIGFFRDLQDRKQIYYQSDYKTFKIKLSFNKRLKYKVIT